MKKTELLNLPIYDSPDVDVFDLQDWNTANQNIEQAYEEMHSFKEEMIKVDANAELVDARKGKENLGEKISEIDSQLEQKAEKVYVGNYLQGLENRVNNLVLPLLPENSNIEVKDAHTSKYKITSYDNLKQRLDHIDCIQSNLLEDVTTTNATILNEKLDDDFSFIYYANRKSSNIINLKQGDIIYFSNKPSNIKWKITSFSSDKLSNETLIELPLFSDFDNIDNYIVNNEDIRAVVITIGKKDDSVITEEEIKDYSNKIKIIKFNNKKIIDINTLNSIMFNDEIKKTIVKKRVFDLSYSYQPHEKRMASDTLNVKFGDILTYEKNEIYDWKISTFNDDVVNNTNTIIEEKTYADCKNINEFTIDNKNIKSIIIQAKRKDEGQITDLDIESFTKLITLKRVKIKSELLSNNEENKPTFLRVGSYNIGHFCEGVSSEPDGTEDKKIEFRKCLAKMNCNIIGLQENDDFYNLQKTETSYNAIYNNFKYYKNGNKYEYNCNGIISDYEIINEYETIFKNNYNQKRYYFNCDVVIDGKAIHLITTQLDFQDSPTRKKQIAELIEEANKYERCIIFGDFNTANRVNNNAYEPYNALFKEDYKLFTDNGFSLANAGYLGEETTLVSRVNALEGNYPWDNVIVSNNIKIKTLEVVKMEYMKDHYPIVVDLVIY